MRYQLGNNLASVYLRRDILRFNSMLISYQQSHIINRQTFKNVAEAGLQVHSLVVEDKDTE